MERVRLAIPDQLPPKGLWSKPETRGCSGQDHAVQTLGRREKKDQSQRGLLPGTSLLASGLTLLLDEVDRSERTPSPTHSLHFLRVCSKGIRQLVPVV